MLSKTQHHINLNCQTSKENQNLQSSAVTYKSFQSAKWIGLSESSINCKSQAFLKESVQEIVDNYKKNPFFKKKLEYFLQKEKKYFRQHRPLEDYDCSRQFQKTDSHYQRKKEYECGELKKLMQIMQILNIKLQQK